MMYWLVAAWNGRPGVVLRHWQMLVLEPFNRHVEPKIQAIMFHEHIQYGVDKKNQLDVTFVFISLLLVAQHVSGNRVSIIKS